MKKILCYGDSNTFGYNPYDASRYDDNTRWTAILQRQLGDDYKITEEGVCDRTGFVDNPKGFIYSSQKHFPVLMETVSDLDILILAVGTNDLQFQYDITDKTVENGLKRLMDLAKTKAGKIIIIPPVELNVNVLKGAFSHQFNDKSIEKSKTVGEIYKRISNLYNCTLFDINEVVKPSDIDGLHYDDVSHQIIAYYLQKCIMRLKF